MAERADPMPASARRRRAIKKLIEALQAEKIPHPSSRALGGGRSDGVILAEFLGKPVLSFADDDAPGNFWLRGPRTIQLMVNDVGNVRQAWTFAGLGQTAPSRCFAPPKGTRTERLT